MRYLGLFIIPIRFDNKIKTYKEYIDLACEIENYGYTHLFIGEHLTDSREDIQSAIVFASAIASRTKKLIICLSVLALPHYDIRLLIKQIEDLYHLSNGRIMIGIGPGALKTDAEYLGFEHSKRGEIFSSKLQEFKSLIQESPTLSNLPKNKIFSTLLSSNPLKASKLNEEGFSILSSNFTNNLNYKNHINCIIAGNNKSLSNWHIIYNLIPNNISQLSNKSIDIIKETLKYIFLKLGEENGKAIMLPNFNKSFYIENIYDELFNKLLIKENDFVMSSNEMYKSYKNGFPIINLFDCLSDEGYTNFLKNLPKKIK